MSLLTTVSSDIGIEEEQDVLGGYQPFESDAYDMTIKLAYLGESSGGAVSFNATFATPDGKELRNTQYITSGTAKGRRNYYEKNGKKYHLPGYNLINNLCLLTLGKELSQLVPEKKTLQIYDPVEGKPMPKEMETLTELHNKTITLGVLKEVVDKVERKDDGSWVPTGTTKVINSISKVFRASDKMTVPEIKAQASEAGFIKDWVSKNKGQTQSNAVGKPTVPSALKSGIPSSAKAAGQADAFQTPPSLFAPKP